MNPVGRKRSFYFPDWMTHEVEAEATRLDRSVSWILQRAWKLARADLQRAEPRTPSPVRDGSFTPPPSPVRDGSFTPTPSPTLVPGTGLAETVNGSPGISARSTRP